MLTNIFVQGMIFEENGRVDKPKEKTYAEKLMEKEGLVSKSPFHEIYTHPEYIYCCRHCGLRKYNASWKEFDNVECIYPNNYNLNMFKSK